MASGFKTVKIEASDMVGHGVKITDGETGEKLPNVFSAEITIALDDVIRVNLGMFVEKLNIEGVPRLFLLGSKDGWKTRREVKKIVFADDSELEFGQVPEENGDGTDAQMLG